MRPARCGFGRTVLDIKRSLPPLSTRFATESGLDVSLGHPMRPVWRGRVHLGALMVWAALMFVLVATADGGVARAGCAIYAAGMCAMFGTSATYHRWVHGLRARAMWRRMDHAAIFLAIAGSATPVMLVTMTGRARVLALALVWTTAAIGMALKLGHWHHGDLVGTILYFVVSAECALVLPALARFGGAVPVALCLVSGATYVIGAVLFALQWPDLRPGVFGYHETWHVATVVAATAHLVAVWMICT